LDLQADADGDGDFDADDVTLQNTLASMISNYGNTGVRGLYRVLDKQGECSDDDTTDHSGQHILSQPTLFNKNVFFTSYQPNFGDACNPDGNGYIYGLNYSWLTSGLNYNTDNDLDDGTEIRDLKDTYRKVIGSSIPSGITIIMKDGEAAGFTSAGGTLLGAGEGGSTSVPGPESPLISLLWEWE
jgi:hypothetical protein